MRELMYEWCDVFTDEPLRGNQLAIFTNAAALTEAEMQAIAREMNLSETTFVLRRDAATERERGVRVRIFTPREELPFAGHPTLGTAAVIRRTMPEYAEAEEIVLDLTVGRIPVRFDRSKSRNGATYAEMTQLDPVFGAAHRAQVVAPLLGLQVEDLGETPPQTVSTGVPFCVVVLRTTEALGRLKLDAAASERYLREAKTHFFYVLAKDTGGWRARMQFYNGEDPATGSAAGCAISYLVRHGFCEPGRTVHIRQGMEMGRRSDLYISATEVDGRVGEVRVGGSTVPVANGRIFLA